MSDDESSSEDEDYKPTNADVNEAEANAQGLKRRKLEGEAGSKVMRPGCIFSKCVEALAFAVAEHEKRVSPCHMQPTT